MKTIKNKTKKVSLMSLTLFASLVLLTSSVMAIEPLVSEEDSSTNKLEMGIESSKLPASRETMLVNELDLKEVADADIEIENWMYNLDNEFWWEILAPENEMQVEAWMSTPWNWFEDTQKELLSCN